MMVVKHRNEEGGLGFYRYKNVTQGGNWIIQPALHNAGDVASLLPGDAPLSTFRVLTASKLGLDSKMAGAGGDGGNDDEDGGSVRTLTTVWRAGRSGATTDHVSVLFDVNKSNGKVNRGTTNQHWYQLGPFKWLTSPWTQDIQYHDHPDTKKKIKGKVIKGMKAIVGIAEKAHRVLVPRVPLVGWDVAVTDKGILLLEGNFSCNFFMGTVDYDWYYDFCDAYFRELWGKRDKATTAPTMPAPAADNRDERK